MNLSTKTKSSLIIITGIFITIAPLFFDGMSNMVFLTVFIGLPILVTGLVKLIKASFENSEEGSFGSKIGKILATLAYFLLVLGVVGSGFIIWAVMNSHT